MPTSGSLAFMVKILRKEMLSKIPNGSMSLIDVRDLAALEIAAIENKEAKGAHALPRPFELGQHIM